VTGTEISHSERLISAELARIGMDNDSASVRESKDFAAKLINARGNTPPDWHRHMCALAARAIAARIASRNGDKEKARKYFDSVMDHMSWLTRKGVSHDELKELSLGIADRMNSWE